MGLINYDYVSKATGVPLNKAYAKLQTLVIEKDGRARAVFAVHQTRESLEEYTPLDKVEVYFTWDRKSNPAEMAYEAAKVQLIEKQDELGNTVREKGLLFGWLDDRV